RVYRGATGEAVGRHETRSAPADPLAEVRSEPDGEQSRAANVFSRHGAREQLSEFVDRGSAEPGRQGVPRHLRLQPQGHERLPLALRAFAVPELFGAEGKRSSEMARGRHVAAGPRPRMVLLS